jgi:hypothetical protein
VGAAQDGADPQHQLPHAERLGQVVVRADLEADHPVDLLALGGQHEHRDLAGLLGGAQPAAHLGSGQVGQHEIEHHQVGARRLRRHLERLSPGHRQPGLVALPAQVVVERGDQVPLVVHDQDQRAHRSPRRSRCRPGVTPG